MTQFETSSGPPDAAVVAAWIQRAHSALEGQAGERAGAAWGSVRMRHRTTRPEWFGDFDQAWANPLPVTAQGDVDLVSGTWEDLPQSVEPLALRPRHLGHRQEVLSTEESSVRMVWDAHVGQVLGWDPCSGRAIHLRDHKPDGYERVSPLRFLVHWAVIAAGGVLVHGAAVGGAEGSTGALILGEAGHGKSTSTLACLARGWRTCGDDAVAAFPEQRGWTAHSIYSSVKTKLDGDELAPARADVVTWEIRGTKRAHLLTSSYDTLLVPKLGIDVLVVLDPSSDPDEPWRWQSASATRTEVAPSTLGGLAFDHLEVMRRIGRLASDTPSVRLPRRRTLSSTVDDLAAICRAAASRNREAVASSA